MTQQPDLKAWVGKTETVEDTLDLTRARAMQATLDLSERPLELGDTLPPLWHWIYFWQVAPLSGLGPDGHPARGGFLPPVALPRRMWAGGRLEFPGNLPLGRRARRRSTIQSVEEKEGRSGKLVFVTARHELSAGGEPGVIEEQDIVYREAASGPYAPPPGEKPSQEADWRVTVTPTPTLLFRYSALTFNGHRIHYDPDYTREEEGYPGLIVHGPLLATYLLQVFRREQPSAKVAGYSFRALRPIFDIAPFTVAGRKDGKLWIEDPEGCIAMRGQVMLG
ncbi:acyl-CoA dehydrogenase [Limibacillus halophilus]